MWFLFYFYSCCGLRNIMLCSICLCSLWNCELLETYRCVSECSLWFHSLSVCCGYVSVCVSVFGFASLSLLCWFSGEQTSLISSGINMQTVWSTQRHKVKHAWREERESALDTVGELCFSPPCHCVFGSVHYGRLFIARWRY